MAEASQYPAIILTIQDLIEPAVGGAVVHLYQRHVGDWKALLELFKVTTISGTAPDTVTTYSYHGWMISRSSVAETWLTNREVVTDHTFKIRGVMGVKDSAATETAFNTVIEAIRTLFRGSFNLSGTCEFHEPIQFPIIDYRIFGGVLCHYAEGTISVRERLQGGT